MGWEQLPSSWFALSKCSYIFFGIIVQIYSMFKPQSSNCNNKYQTLVHHLIFHKSSIKTRSKFKLKTDIQIKHMKLCVCYKNYVLVLMGNGLKSISGGSR